MKKNIDQYIEAILTQFELRDIDMQEAIKAIKDLMED